MNKTPHPNILLKLENPSCLHSGTPKATTSAENRLQLPSLHHRPYRDSTSRVSARPGNSDHTPGPKLSLEPGLRCSAIRSLPSFCLTWLPEHIRILSGFPPALLTHDFRDFCSGFPYRCYYS